MSTVAEHVAEQDAITAAHEARKTWIVVVGNPMNGLSFYGPFDTEDEADAFDESLEDCDRWVAELEEPQ